MVGGVFRIRGGVRARGGVRCRAGWRPGCDYVFGKKTSAQSQFGVIGFGHTFWAAAPKGTKSCRTQGESVRPSIRSSVLLSAFLLSRKPCYSNSH